jgi:hypothetical protein
VIGMGQFCQMGAEDKNQQFLSSNLKEITKQKNLYLQLRIDGLKTWKFCFAFLDG